MTRSSHQSTKRVAGRQGKKTAQGKTPAKLLVAMTGKASAAKTAKGAEPVFAYIASLPQPQRGIAERLDALAAKSLPDLQRAVKWGMAYYGVDGGWCFSSGAFVGHVKLMFIRGTEIKPEPPVTPIGMGKSTRGVELASVDDFDERQLASWIKQAATMPFLGERSDDYAVAQRSGRREGQRDRGVASVAMPFIRGSRIQTQKTGLGACHPTVRGEIAQNETREPFRRMWA